MTVNFFYNYVYAMDSGEKIAKKFIIENKAAIIKHCGRSVYKEFILNYRSHFTPSKGRRIIKEFESLIINKKQHHTSDVAIGYNIIHNICITPEEEQMIIEFIYDRIRDSLSQKLINSSAFDTASFNIKKRIILDAARKTLDKNKMSRTTPPL